VDPTARLQVARFPLLAALGGDPSPARGLHRVNDPDDDGGEQQEAEAAEDHRDHGDHLPMRCGRLPVARDIIFEFLPRGRTPAAVVAVA